MKRNTLEQEMKIELNLLNREYLSKFFFLIKFNKYSKL